MKVVPLNFILLCVVFRCVFIQWLPTSGGGCIAEAICQMQRNIPTPRMLTSSSFYYKIPLRAGNRWRAINFLYHSHFITIRDDDLCEKYLWKTGLRNFIILLCLKIGGGFKSWHHFKHNHLFHKKAHECLPEHLRTLELIRCRKNLFSLMCPSS